MTDDKHTTELDPKSIHRLVMEDLTRPTYQGEDGKWRTCNPLPFYLGPLTKDYWINFFRLLGQAIRGEKNE